MRKWQHPQHSVHHFTLLITTKHKDIHNQNFLRLKTTYIDNQYGVYSRACTDGSYMLEGDDFTVSYATVSGICSLRIFISIESVEGLITFVLDISNVFQNTILHYPEEIIYPSLLYLYLDW